MVPKWHAWKQLPLSNIHSTFLLSFILPFFFSNHCWHYILIKSVIRAVVSCSPFIKLFFAFCRNNHTFIKLAIVNFEAETPLFASTNSLFLAFKCNLLPAKSFKISGTVTMSFLSFTQPELLALLIFFCQEVYFRISWVIISDFEFSILTE